MLVQRKSGPTMMRGIPGQQGSLHDFEKGEEDDAKTNRRTDTASDAFVFQNDERSEIRPGKKRTAQYFATIIVSRMFTKQKMSIM
jgi:hypothetical protein